MLNLNFNHIKSSCFFIFLLILHNTVYASDISIQLSQHSINNRITVSVTNKSAQALQLSKIRLKLNQKTYWISAQEIVKENENKQYNFIIEQPTMSGSYAQITSVFYYNEGYLFSLSDVGYFNYNSVKQFDNNAKLNSGQKGQQSFLNLSARHPELWSIIIPDEVTSTELNQDKSKVFFLKGKYSGFNSNYPVFAIKEDIINNQHFTKILRTVVSIKHAAGSAKLSYQRGRMSNLFLLIITILSLVTFLFVRKKTIANQYFSSTILLLFSSRLFFLSAAYLLLKNANDLLSFSSLLSEHFSGKNYRYFFLYFIDAYFWSFVFLYLPFLIFIEKPDRLIEQKNSRYSVKEDKYVAVLLWLLQPIINRTIEYSKQVKTPKHYKLSKHQLQSPLKTGWLLLAVKFFFLPFLASWVIGNFIHQWNLIQNFNWTFHQINAFILALLILTDTSIFLFGYMFESSQMGSKVRSVEPTILGWVVCLWCYPPFNTFSFAPFDINFVNIHIPIANWAEPLVLVSITLFWGVFVWGSIALGFKASNLTNRGIISTGPYRYCRHPAYTAKITVWLIEAVFLGQYFIGLFLGFLIMYLLRALTEERHLSLDPDYQAYKKKVPYRFIPGII